MERFYLCGNAPWLECGASASLHASHCDTGDAVMSIAAEATNEAERVLVLRHRVAQ